MNIGIYDSLNTCVSLLNVQFYFRSGFRSNSTGVFFFLVELILQVLDYVGNDIFWAQYSNSKPNLKIRTVQIMYTYPIIIAMVWINGYPVAFFFFYIGNID